MKRIIYLPLEPLAERYTIQLSAQKTGWLESRWIENNISYIRIEGEKLTSKIKHGVVLDANGRGYWAMSQIQKLLQLIDKGKISNDDAIYFDDFWHPGISALPYSFNLMGIKPKMYAMVHAQSVDQFDFTYPMRYWMRDFEKGIGKILDGIFVTSTILRDLLLYAGIGIVQTVHIAGLPYNSDEVKTHWPGNIPKKKKQVVFSSRWDIEKCPITFLKVVDKVLQVRTDIIFIITTSAEHLRSNSQALIDIAQEYLRKYPNNLFLRENQTKEQYYQTLLESTVQINTADQDFVSWTLLEAVTCGCYPLYPYFLSFPEAIEFNHSYLYQKEDIIDASKKLIQLVDSVIPTIFDFYAIYKKYDKSWERMYHIMKGETYESLYSN